MAPYLVQAISADGLTLTLAQSQPETVANLGVDSSIGHLSGSPTLTFAPADSTTNRMTGAGTLLSFQPGDASTNRVQVGTQLTFVPGAFSSQPRIVRQSGDWNAEGFVAGETITVFGTASSGASEDGTYTIQSISADGLTLLLGGSPKLVARTVSTSASVGIAINNGLISRNIGQLEKRWLRFRPVDRRLRHGWQRSERRWDVFDRRDCRQCDEPGVDPGPDTPGPLGRGAGGRRHYQCHHRA